MLRLAGRLVGGGGRAKGTKAEKAAQGRAAAGGRAAEQPPLRPPTEPSPSASVAPAAAGGRRDRGERFEVSGNDVFHNDWRPEQLE